MFKRINDVNIHYDFDDISSDITIVLLHGWGQNIEMMKPLGESFKEYFNILYVDLPGFGKSEEPYKVWSVYDYSRTLHKLFNELNLNKIILIGHSFGGKISLVYSSIYKVEKLVCLASPYCKEITRLPIKTKIYKKIKKVWGLRWLSSILSNFIGSSDYKKASTIMRGVLVNSINIDIIEDIKKIKTPTLLIWGTLDTAVPLKRAYELESLIKDSGVVVYEGATHYAYLERLNEVVCVLYNFFNIKE